MNPIHSTEHLVVGQEVVVGGGRRHDYQYIGVVSKITKSGQVSVSNPTNPDAALIRFSARGTEIGGYSTYPRYLSLDVAQVRARMAEVQRLTRIRFHANASFSAIKEAAGTLISSPNPVEVLEAIEGHIKAARAAIGLAPSPTYVDELKQALGATLDYIDALPDTLTLPAMPGFDRDWVDSLLADGAGAAATAPGSEH